MLLLGIDPGFSGAIALLDTRSNQLTVHDMPVVPGAKGKTVLNLHRLVTLLSTPDDPQLTIAVLEKVSPRPGEGVSSAFRFGQGYGSIEMALVGCGWEQNYVTPTTWKKHFKLSSDKGVSRSLAMQRFPDSAHLFTRVKDDGRAEAALLALYAREVILPAQGRAAA